MTEFGSGSVDGDGGRGGGARFAHDRLRLGAPVRRDGWEVWDAGDPGGLPILRPSQILRAVDRHSDHRVASSRGRHRPRRHLRRCRCTCACPREAATSLDVDRVASSVQRVAGGDRHDDSNDEPDGNGAGPRVLFEFCADASRQDKPPRSWVVIDGPFDCAESIYSRVVSSGQRSQRAQGVQAWETGGETTEGGGDSSGERTHV